MLDTEHFSIEADPTFEDVRFLEDRLYEYPPISAERNSTTIWEETARF